MKKNIEVIMSSKEIGQGWEKSSIERENLVLERIFDFLIESTWINVGIILQQGQYHNG